MIGIRPPQILISVRARDSDNDACLLGDEIAQDRGIASRGPHGHGDRWPVAEDLVAECVQEGHLVDVRAPDAGLAAKGTREVLADFGTEASLPIGAHAHHVDGPGHADGDGLVAGDEECHHLVYHSVLGHLLTSNHDAEDINFC